MKIAVIGRTEVLLSAARRAVENGHTIGCVITATPAPEYLCGIDDFREFAEALGVPFLATARLEVASDLLRKSKCDVGISMNFPNIIGQAQIDELRLGILNLHGGDLPRYRGNACQAWALLNAETKIGLCVHKMLADELDSGDIITRSFREVNQNTKIGEVLEWIRDVGPRLLMDAVSHLETDAHYVLEIQSRDPEQILRCYPLGPEDGRINWTQDSADVLRRINAFNRPYAGAFCLLGEEHVRIWDAAVIHDEERFCAVPGQITRVGPDFVDVACGSGKLRVREIETSEGVCAPNRVIRSIRQRFR